MTTQKMFSVFGILFILIILSSCAGIQRCENKLTQSEKNECYEQHRIDRGYYDRGFDNRR